MRKTNRNTVVLAFKKQYKKASKKTRGIILQQLEQTTGYSRNHIGQVLLKVSHKKRIKRKRVSRYFTVIKPLRILWAVSNYACGQRLKPLIPSLIAALRRHKELTVSKEERTLFLQISSATIDRLLTHERKKINLKRRSRTKPGSLLKHQIPIKTWRDWDNTVPGFLEIDSVHHCGGSLFGDYVYTLDTTDVATGWNECRAHMGRGEYRTIQALDTIRGRLPFPLLGIDFDCGGEFVNYHLVRYCDRNHITYTRAREGIKNDQPYIEQQNYSVVRRFVGYQRLDTEKQLQRVNKLYILLSDYQNFFQPVMRLKTKVRDGAKVTRIYDKPLTAYQRVLKRKDIPKATKDKLRIRYKKLNPKKLLLEITNLGKKLSDR